MHRDNGDGIARLKELYRIATSDKATGSQYANAAVEIIAALPSLLDEVERVRQAVADERSNLFCSQCGEPIWGFPCGPTHAIKFAKLDKAIRSRGGEGAVR